jgi:hypothetical protein
MPRVEYKSKTRSVLERRLRHPVHNRSPSRAASMAFANQKQKSASLITADPRWRKVVDRDARADGSFWYGVATTGVYCKPSCSSRRANPQNVTFFADCHCFDDPRAVDNRAIEYLVRSFRVRRRSRAADPSIPAPPCDLTLNHVRRRGNVKGGWSGRQRATQGFCGHCRGGRHGAPRRPRQDRNG